MLHRFIADYTTYPADYAEVSSFSKPPSECNSGSRSPAPYATTTLVGNSRLINFKNNNQNMYYTSDLYPPAANRYVYSESYYNPKEKINITENRLGSNTFNPSISVPHTPFGTVRKNRFNKLLRNPQFRISFGDGAKSGDDRQPSEYQSQHPDHGEQLYVKVGETNLPSEYNNWTPGHPPQLPNGQPGQPGQSMAHPQQQPHTHTAPIHSTIYQNHRQPSDKDMIYAPSGNRSVISYMSANNRFDDV